MKNIKIKDWGKDHWSLLAYIECRCVDHKGILDKNHLRISNPAVSMSPIDWKPEYGTRLKCDSLEQQFLRNVTAYDRLYHDPDSKTSSSSAGWSLPVAENLHVNINNSKGIQTHHQLIPKGQLLVE